MLFNLEKLAGSCDIDELKLIVEKSDGSIFYPWSELVDYQPDITLTSDSEIILKNKDDIGKYTFKVEA